MSSSPGTAAPPLLKNAIDRLPDSGYDGFFLLKEDLIGRQIVGVVNFPAKQIGPIRSEFLLTGFYRDDREVVLAIPERPVANGAKLL
jgi:hypothetical protein